MSVTEFRYTICPVGNASFLAVNRDDSFQRAFAAKGVTPIRLQTLPKEQWLVHYNYQDPALFREGGNIPPIWSKSNGAEVVLLGLAFLPQRSFILTKADSPIEQVEDLRGKRLAVPQRIEFPIDFYKATVERGFETALTARGVSAKEVEYVILPVGEDAINSDADHKSNLGAVDLDALDSGRADAIYSGGVRAQRLLQSGNYKVVYQLSGAPDLVSPINNSYPNVLTVSRRLAEDAPEVVVEYLKQVLLAANWAKTHLTRVLELFAKQLHGSVGEVVSAWPAGFHQNLHPNLSEKGLLALESQKRFLYDHGYIQKDFDIEKWADGSFLEAAQREISRQQAASA